MLFTGHYEHTIDAKHRLAIPSHIRSRWRPSEHGEAWYAVPWVGHVVRLYTEAEFESLASGRRLGLTPDADEAELFATLFGLSSRIEMDSAGRIRLSEDTLELVELGSEVVLVGVGGWLEIRDRQQWRDGRRESLEKMPALMAKIEAKRLENGRKTDG